MRKVLSFVLVLMCVLALSVGVAFADTSPPIDIGVVTDFMDWLPVLAVAVTGVVGLLALLVSLFVEATKTLPFLRRMPTDLHVIIVSFIFSEILLFGLAAWQDITIRWYYIALALFMSLGVSFVAMYGWEKVSALWLRFNRLKE